MENGSFFKTATFGGFEKKDVLNYVDELHRKVFKLEGDIAKLVADNEKLISDRDQLRAQLENAVESAQQPIAEVSEDIKATLTERDQRIAQLNEKLEEQQRFAAARENQIIDLNTRLAESDARFEQMSKRAAKYDEASIEVGAVLLDARRTADQIISQAQQKAQELTGESQQYVSQLEGKLAQMKTAISDINSSIEDNLRRQTIRNESILALIDSAVSAVKAPKLEEKVYDDQQESGDADASEAATVWKPEAVDENIFR